MKKLIIIGASGHGEVVADIAKHCGYSEIAFLDDNPKADSCLGFPVVGPLSDKEKYRDRNFFIAIGNAKTRKKIQQDLLDEGYSIATLIHPNAVAADSARIGCGTVVMAGAVINPNVEIGQGCIINTGATVDHDDVIEDYVHISVGAHLSGTVFIGKNTWVGTGAIISNNTNICPNCTIGAGTVVIKDITTSGTYVGVPARRLNKMEDSNILETSRFSGGGNSI